ncbi:MAG: STAS domain-containing protein [Phycisphaerales bacterium]|jgi:anti-sigma B factor antagonist|nr:STAS domain-containing protein [Phycisphaerales bacterium]
MTDHPTPPKVDVEWVGENVVARITGDINATQADITQQPLLELLAGKPGKLVLNFENVAYMDSAGLASFVKLLSRARKNDIELHMVALSPMLKGLFEITRLDTVFDISDTEEAVLG